MSTRSDSKPAEGAAATPPVGLVKAVTTLLRPLVNALVAHGITFPFLAGMLKKIYVDVVDRDFPLDGKQQTASRISLMSGVHRKDVRRLLAEAPAETGPPRGVSVGARLIGIWTGSPDYVDERGNPLPLPRTAGGSARISFDSLVESINRRDIRPRAVLDELLRLGIVRVEDDLVHLDTSAFLPSEGFDELAYYFGRNLRDHIAAASHNLRDRTSPYPERAVYYDRLSPQSVAALRKMAAELSMEALLKVNKEALRLADEDEGKPDATQRMTLGFYYYDADSGAATDKKDTD